ncbi:MAG: Ig-like domain-containing protein, partial [Bacteroidales bacterium]|nr:Ig-like domain-containing protein [Bacteroidales bacterium]
VTVKRLVASIGFDKTTISLYPGQTASITATVSPSTANERGLTWESSNTSVATVSSSGVVTGVAKGSAVITATAKDGSGVSKSCQVEVTQYVTGITLSKTTLSLNEGEYALLTETVSPSTAYDKSVTWSSSDRAIATVDQSGKVTAVSKGTAMIMVTANDGSGKSASCSVTVIRLVSSITLNKTAITIYNGKTETLTATVSPSTANNTGVKWTSSNTSVASVSSSGVVTGVARGTATITVTAKDGSGKSASCQVEVKQYVTGITLNKTSLSLNEGLTSPLSVSSITPDNANDKTYTWSSSNTSIATVSTTGVVTAVSKGTATITATANDGSGKSASCSVTVIRLVSSITLDKASISIYNGKTQTLTATVSPSTANNTGVTWTSSNTSVATVSSSGVVTGVGRGAATITVTAKDGSGKSASCQVEVKQYVTGVTLNKTSLSLNEGQTSTLSVSSITPDNANDKSVTWSSSDRAIATVDQSGKVTAVSKGTVMITATANDGSGKSVSCEVTVIRLVSSITLDKTITIYNGKAQTLTATVSPSTANNTGVTWTSSNTSVATVSSSGEVTGVSRGTATITATAQDGSGKSASCEVEVKQYVTGITLNTTDIFLYEGQTSTLSVSSITPDNANDKTYTWSSSRTSVATVSASGVVTAVSKGMTEITATANDGSGKTASCEVWVLRPVSSITLDKTSITIYNGTTQTLTATVSPSTASNTSVTWTSSNISVATVSTSGVVTGVARGTATITATAKDSSGKFASCEVKVGQNLSVGSSANCYIVSVPGDYCFRTTKGNSSTSVGSVISAEVLWESYGTSTTPSVGSVINNVSYSNNTITFSTPSTLNNGNAVIAAKDASGTILWSWHIWVCNGYNPEAAAQVYYNNAGTMMDRNLGATSATPGDVGALGLLYQWGRKDPFLGGSSISSSTKAVSTLSTWPSPVASDSSTGKVAYAVAHPTTFITGVIGTNYDWVYSSRDNTLWKSAKTIYDPCPPGWRVPDGGSSGVWSIAAGGSNGFIYTVDSSNRGVNFSGKFGSSEAIWYPSTGVSLHQIKDVVTGKVKEIVSYFTGSWWSCTPNDSKVYILSLGYGPRVYPSESASRYSNYSVRCLQE